MLRPQELLDAPGIGVITDEEQRRFDFMDSLLGAVSGVDDLAVASAVRREDFWHRQDPGYEPKQWVPR